MTDHNSTKTVIINGEPITVPDDVVAYKLADPLEGGRWVYDEGDARNIEREDPSLLVRAT